MTLLGQAYIMITCPECLMTFPQINGESIRQRKPGIGALTPLGVPEFGYRRSEKHNLARANLIDGHETLLIAFSAELAWTGAKPRIYTFPKRI